MDALRESKIVWAMILAYFIFFGIFTSLRHYNFQTQTWDLAIFVQSLWNTLQGKVMHNNLEEVGNTLGVHFSPILFLLVPGYALFPTPYFLLIIQTLALAMGAWPAYLLSRKIIGKKGWPLIFAAGYLLYPSLHWINTFDFHPVAFLIPLLLASFYFLETKQWGWAYLFLILSAATREDSILAVLFVGIYLFLRAFLEKNQKEMKIGFAIITISTFYFLLSTKIIMPALGGGLLRIDRYAQLGNTPKEIIKNIPGIVFTAGKLNYLLRLFLPMIFLPLLSWPAAILLAPGLTENLLTDYQRQFSSFYQYDSVLVGSIFAASLYGLKWILAKQPEKEKVFRRMLIAAVIIGYVIYSPINPIFFPTDLFFSNPRWEAFRAMVKLVPKNPQITVAANTNLIPHLSNREHAYMLGREPFPVDMVLIDGGDLFGFQNETEFQNYVDNYLNSGQYAVQTLDNRYLILTKKIPSPL